MSSIKAVWITEHKANHSRLFTLSFESAKVAPEYMRVKVKELAFPEVPSKNHPKRHTIALSMLTMDDLETIVETLEAYIDKNGEEAL